MRNFLETMKLRRSIYGICNDSPITDEKIEELVGEAVKYTPSAFNMQSARVVILFAGQHLRLWQIVMEKLAEKVPAENFAPTREKIESFAAGHGTILFFDESAITNQFAEQFALYRDNFPIWAQQANGMLQFACWNLLDEKGLGASLQHYNPLIDDAVRSEWSIPESWKLIAQMPFGTTVSDPQEKTFEPVEKRVLRFG